MLLGTRPRTQRDQTTLEDARRQPVERDRLVDRMERDGLVTARATPRTGA